MKELKNTKGITLIALIITIIVLLILAGVTISAITSNESAPQKAVEAKDANEKGAELEAIKVATVSSIVEGNYNLNTNIETLRDGLRNLVTDDVDTVINENSTEWTVTGKTGEKYRITNDGDVFRVGPVKEIKIGDSITYNTSHNEVPLSDWKVLYKKTVNETEYVYLILADYLPYNAIGTMTGLQKGNKGTEIDYGVGADTRDHLLNAMTTRDNWSSLLKGTINGKNINYIDSSDSNITAMGSPTIDLWVDSWNISNPDTYIYYASNNTGYSSGLSENSLSIKGVSNIGITNTLYFPYSYEKDACSGYWIASPSANGKNYVVDVELNSNGSLGCRSRNVSLLAFRPVVCLPASDLQ